MAPNNSPLLFKPVDEEMEESLARLSNKNYNKAPENSRPRLPPGMAWTNAGSIVNIRKNQRSNSFGSDPGQVRKNSSASDPGMERRNSFASDPGLPGPHPPPGPKPQAVYNRRKTAKGGMRKQKTRRYRF